MISGKAEVTGFREIERLLKSLTPEALMEAAKPAVRAEAERALPKMRQRVRRGLFFAKGIKELASYFAYEKALTVKEYEAQGEWAARVGLPPSLTVAGIDPDLLGRRIEYGTTAVAPVPHIRPLYLELSNDLDMRGRLAKRFTEELNDWLSAFGLEATPVK